MPDFSPTQYEAREGRDTYIARATGKGGAFTLLRVDPRDSQVDLGTFPNLGAANTAKDEDVAIRTAAHIHAYVVDYGEKGVSAYVTNYAGFPERPESGVQRFADVGEFEAAYPNLELHGEGANGNRVYMTPAVQGRKGR